MEYKLNTQLNGCVAMTTNYHENNELAHDNSLYKFFWVQTGTLTMIIDHIEVLLEKNEIISLTPLQHIQIKEVNGTYLCLAFNSNFYCIFGHDNEVSCNGLLFHGSSNIIRIQLTPEESERLHSISSIFKDECVVQDSLQEEMLRIVLKRFIITCTRVARKRFAVTEEKEKSFDLIRQFYVLVDTHFKEKKQVRDYAEMLYRSPKTLSNLFLEYDLPSPLKVIHDRIDAEAKRLLLYTNKTAKEIADLLNFDDLPTFSRFFKKMNGESISEFRKREKRD